MKQELLPLTTELIKGVPPVSVLGLHLFGITLSSITLTITLIYTGLLLFFLIKDRIYSPFKEWFKKKRIEKD